MPSKAVRSAGCGCRPLPAAPASLPFTSSGITSSPGGKDCWRPSCLSVGWSPAFQEWDHLEWARQQGVPVPRVVAAGEFIGPAGRLQSFLAVEELTDMLPLHEAIPLAAQTLAPAIFRRWKRALVSELARLTRLIHDRRTFHKDLYLCHFYIARDDTQQVPDWHNRVHLIDLHRLTHHPLDLALVADQGPGPAAVLQRRQGRRHARSAGILAGLSRHRALA